MRLISTLIPTLFAAAALAAPVFAGDEVPNPGKHAGQHHEEMLAKFDTNHDGKLDDAEKTTARAALAARLKEKHPELLAKLDTNGDGVISEMEMKAGRELLKAARAERQKHKTDKTK